MKKNHIHIEFDNTLYDYLCRFAREHSLSVTSALKVILAQHRKYISCTNPVIDPTNSGRVQ